MLASGRAVPRFINYCLKKYKYFYAKLLKNQAYFAVNLPKFSKKRKKAE
jgi:hypothetical protein